MQSDSLGYPQAFFYYIFQIKKSDNSEFEIGIHRIKFFIVL
ncbi:hypothetical protein SRABI133_03971 [Peribacillus simplex]|uniref:Uncharacterized protein n=1 Tax=Peribacillus simplex TaxID=1478 RepID=A0A9W4PHK4_9BACI|nr:hypothetical protein SRABI133_03971 [Peribacillus simplex]